MARKAGFTVGYGSPSLPKHEAFANLVAAKEREALAQTEQEPVATIAVRWHEPVGKVAYVLEVNLPVGIHKVYTTPPQRTWVGLTDEERYACLQGTDWQYDPESYAVVIEAKLKEKNESR